MSVVRPSIAKKLYFQNIAHSIVHTIDPSVACHARTVPSILDGINRMYKALLMVFFYIK
jgi:hypothetical protein